MNRNEIITMNNRDRSLKEAYEPKTTDSSINPHIEQALLRTAIVRDGALIRASVMHESWYEDTIPNPDVPIHRPRPFRETFPTGKTPLPEVARYTCYSEFTRLYSPY